jgi:cysteine desulfuration protein SufE
VQGCASRVWLVAEQAGKRCRFKVDADSTLVRSLAALLCELYDGATPEAICAHEPTLLEALHLTDHLSPTRRHGFQRITVAIHSFAAECLAR